MRLLCRVTFLSTVLALLTCATSATAQVPGSNGDVVIVRGTSTGSQYVVEQLDPTVGGVTSTTPYDGTRKVNRLHYASTGSAVAVNTTLSESCGGVPKCSGAYLGSPDAIGGVINGPMYFPGNALIDENTCIAAANVATPLADGTLLWAREWDFKYADGASNCNSLSGRIREDYVITTPGNEVLRTVFSWEYRNAVQTGTRMPGTVIGSGSDPDVIYTQVLGSGVLGMPGEGIYRVTLSTQQAVLVASPPSTFRPSDVSPDGRMIVGTNYNDVTIIDVATGQSRVVLTAAQADAIQPSTKVNPGAYTGLQYPTFAPDGTRIAMMRQNSTDGGGRDAAISIALDGSAGKVLHEVPAGTYMSRLTWRPSPGFQVEVDGDQLVGDIVEFDLNLTNPRDHAFSDLEYVSAGADGIIFNDKPFSPENRARFSPLAGPAPSLASLLGPKLRITHQYLVGFDSPGSLQVRGQVRATHPNGARVESKGTATVVSQLREMGKAERAQIASAAYAELQNEMYDNSLKMFDKTQAQIDKALKSTLSGSKRSAALAESPLEQALATNMGLPDDSLSWLPKDPKVAVKAYWAFQQGAHQGEQNVVRQKLGSAYKFVIGEPWAYWKQQFTGDAATTMSTVDQLAREGSYYAAQGEKAVRAFGSSVNSYVNDPAARKQMNEAVAESAALFEQRMAKVAKLAPAQAKSIAKEFQRDPVAGARKLGTVYGTLRAEAGVAAIETVVGNKLSGAKVVKRISANLKRFDKAVGHTDEMADAAEDVFSPLGAATRASKYDKPPSAAQLGMPKTDQKRWQGIVAKLEQHAKDKYGVDLDLELSFRPRNVHSANVKDAAGKNMFMKGKTGTDLDVMLGMDPSGLGKLSIYKPKRPANYAKLDPLQQKEIDLRIKDINKAYKEWNDPKSAMGKAQRKGGVELQAKLENGAPVTKIKMQIQGVEKNGTISVRYNEFVVDGKAIVKRGSKPKWVVSDYDGNAFLQAKGKKLPGGAVRGALEAELMRLQREAGVDMPTSFHGFTANGFDMSAKHYRMNFHFLLEGMTRKEADKAVAMYIRKYAQNADEVKALMENYKYGDYVVRVTRDAATGGQGL